ncbi:MAG: DUF6161 domain-containing protein [Bacteroidia bacterium]|nr:DUF6161 domain-containing protein [Bacteroidia bacterium]
MSENVDTEAKAPSITFSSGFIHTETATVVGISAAIEFCTREYDFWESIRADKPRDPVGIIANRHAIHYNHQRQRLSAFIDPKSPSSITIEEIQKGLNTKVLHGSKVLILFSDSPITSRLIDYLQRKGAFAEGVMSYLGHANIGEQLFSGNSRPESAELLRGFLSAHRLREMHTQTGELGTDPSLSALNSILQTARDTYTVAFSELGETRDKLETNTTKFTSDMESLISQANTQWEEERVEREKAAHQVDVEFDNLKNRFQEQLRLRGPSKQWEAAATEHRNWGLKWAALLIATIVCSTILVVHLLYNPPEVFGVSISEWTKPETIKGLLLFAALLSLLAFLVRTFSKLAISSFHLQRDASERLVLTSYFLALIEEGAIQPEDREIVLKSLFSRADTGLLSGDSGPTMPTSGTIFETFASKKQN